MIVSFHKQDHQNTYALPFCLTGSPKILITCLFFYCMVFKFQYEFLYQITNLKVKKIIQPFANSMRLNSLTLYVFLCLVMAEKSSKEIPSENNMSFQNLCQKKQTQRPLRNRDAQSGGQGMFFTSWRTTAQSSFPRSKT